MFLLFPFLSPLPSFLPSAGDKSWVSAGLFCRFVGCIITLTTVIRFHSLVGVNCSLRLGRRSALIIRSFLLYVHTLDLLWIFEARNPTSTLYLSQFTRFLKSWTHICLHSHHALRSSRRPRRRHRGRHCPPNHLSQRLQVLHQRRRPILRARFVPLLSSFPNPSTNSTPKESPTSSSPTTPSSTTRNAPSMPPS